MEGDLYFGIVSIRCDLYAYRLCCLWRHFIFTCAQKTQGFQILFSMIKYYLVDAVKCIQGFDTPIVSGSDLENMKRTKGGR